MLRLLACLMLSILLVAACDRGTIPSKSKPAPQVLVEPVKPVVTELPSEAVPVWRETLPSKGTLVLMSTHPFLEPIEAERVQELEQLVASGTRDDFWRRGSFNRADPALVPTEAVSAALLGGMFSEIVWIFPGSVEPGQLPQDSFHQQLIDARFLTEEEAGQLTFADGVFTGLVRGVPLRIVHPKVLPKIDGPFVLHVDLGYFRGLYQGEVKTPIYDMLHSACQGIKTVGWRPQAITLSYSTIDGFVSHDVRFLLSNLAEILQNPKLLEQMPPSWAKRGEAMYLTEFFQEQKGAELLQQNAADNPKDAGAQYDYYKSLFEQQKFDEAFKQLDKAVALDSGYGAAYLDLAQIAETDQNLAVGEGLLSKAANIYPVNPFIDLYRVQFLLQMGRFDEAKSTLDGLQKLTWSSRYHPQIPGGLKQMADFAANPPPVQKPN